MTYPPHEPDDPPTKEELDAQFAAIERELERRFDAIRDMWGDEDLEEKAA